jgi:glycine/D-amino acid oxidase-like deaminating enzyme
MIPEVDAWRDAEPRPFWFAPVDGAAPEPLRGSTGAELCIVGGGFTGLWAALAAAERDPGRRIVLLEAEHAGFGGSARNGGFCVTSLTHGIANGLARFPEETTVLERLGRENLDGLVADLATHGIDCDWEPVGDVLVATRPHEESWMDEEAALLRAHGNDVEVWDAERTRREIASPTYRRAVWNRSGGGILDPGKLARGLRESARRAGVEVHEGTPAVALERDGAGVRVRTPEGEVRAEGVLLATGAAAPLVRAVRRYVAPVYDYVLVTEPLSAAQRASLGWAGRQGVGDSGNRFHYYRLTADDRILWGGYEAVYRFGGRVGPERDQDPAVFALLAEHFFATFPQLEGLRFTHRWGGAIDTCSRFSAFFGTALGGSAVYVAGYTGLGVGASRFGGRTALDLLDGRETEATSLRYVRSRPVPFPPEPLRTAVIQLTRNRLAAADEHAGRRGLWLRTLDALGLGFDS